MGRWDTKVEDDTLRSETRDCFDGEYIEGPSLISLRVVGTLVKGRNLREIKLSVSPDNIISI